MIENKVCAWYPLKNKMIFLEECEASEWYWFFNDVKLKRMYWTGLKDRNDKDIYEGDVLISVTEEPSKGKVFYYDGSYCLTSDFVSSVNDESVFDVLNKDLILDNHLEVIGNIYANPELLEVE